MAAVAVVARPRPTHALASAELAQLDTAWQQLVLRIELTASPAVGALVGGKSRQ